MYKRNLENGLALIAALIVLFGVTSAANTALADNILKHDPSLIFDGSALNQG